MRKLLFLVAAALALAVSPSRAETLTMGDGAAFTGDIVKSDDNGVLLHAGEVYTNLPWGRFSQESLKQLAANPKLRPYVEVFILPDASARPPKAEVAVNNYIKRLARPENPSVLGGLVHSPLGLLILALLYLANLYAAYEVALIRARPAAQVVGAAAVLPVIAPVIFLALPTVVPPVVEEKLEYAPAGTEAAAAKRSPEEIQIAEASWKKEEKKPEAQVFTRGKFTFNKRFLETKFASFVGAPKGEALKFVMELKTGQALHGVECIMQVGVAEVILETKAGQVTVPFADIQEIKLIPK